MPVTVTMPALSPTMTEGTLARWLVVEGEKVTAGDILAEIETDKATMEIEAAEDGTVGRLLVTAGTENVPVNTPILMLVSQNEDPANLETLPLPADSTLREGTAPRIESFRSNNAPEMESPSGRALATKSLTVREALRDAMAEEMRRDPNVFLMGEEVAEYQGAYKVSQGLLEEFGSSRIIDTPITEQGFTGLGVGAALTGLRPVIEFMTFNFAMQAIDQIINSAGKTHYMSGGQMNCPIVFRGPNGAAARVAAQHSQDYSAWYAHCPGLRVIAPYTAADAKGLLKSAIRDPNPVVFLENEILYGKVFEVPIDEDCSVPFGKARIARAGADVTIVAHSISVGYALEAAQRLESENIDAEVIDLRSLRPLDIETILKSVQKTNRCVTVEEGWPGCGIGSEIAIQVMEHAFDYLDAPVARVAGEDVPMPYAANLEKMALPNAEKVAAKVKSVCYR